MKQSFRLKRSKDIQHVKESGRVVQNALMVLVYSKNEGPNSRMAVVASKKIGNAVTRNQVKRRMRAAIKLHKLKILPSWDLIFYARPPISQAKFKEIHCAVNQLLNQAGILGEQ